MLKGVALFVCVGQVLNAQVDPWLYWSLSQLKPGRGLTVETFPPKRKVKGIFAGRDADAITLQLKSGTAETISRRSIRKVTAKRKAYDYAPLAGAAAGAITLGTIASRPKWDFTGGAVAWLTGIGAGIGALVGWAIRAAGNDELIYQAPKP